MMMTMMIKKFSTRTMMMLSTEIMTVMMFKQTR